MPGDTQATTETAELRQSWVAAQEFLCVPLAVQILLEVGPVLPVVAQVGIDRQRVAKIMDIGGAGGVRVDPPVVLEIAIVQPRYRLPWQGVVRAQR